MHDNLHKKLFYQFRHSEPIHKFKVLIARRVYVIMELRKPPILHRPLETRTQINPKRKISNLKMKFI